MCVAVRFEIPGDPFAVNHFHCYTLDANPEYGLGQLRTPAATPELENTLGHRQKSPQHNSYLFSAHCDAGGGSRPRHQ